MYLSRSPVHVSLQWGKRVDSDHAESFLLKQPNLFLHEPAHEALRYKAVIAEQWSGSSDAAHDPLLVRLPRWLRAVHAVDLCGFYCMGNGASWSRCALHRRLVCSLLIFREQGSEGTYWAFLTIRFVRPFFIITGSAIQLFPLLTRWPLSLLYSDFSTKVSALVISSWSEKNKRTKTRCA